MRILISHLSGAPKKLQLLYMLNIHKFKKQKRVTLATLFCLKLSNTNSLL